MLRPWAVDSVNRDKKLIYGFVQSNQNPTVFDSSGWNPTFLMVSTSPSSLVNIVAEQTGFTLFVGFDVDALEWRESYSVVRTLSKHASGMAIDINPLQNPCIRGSSVQPATATDYVDRSKAFPHKIDETDFCKQVFESFGFRWGGHWRSVKDYQHFEKNN